MKILSRALCLLPIALGGCIGTPTARVATESGQTVRVPTTLTGTQSPASTLILGVQ